MKLFGSILLFALAADVTVASIWGNKAAYKNWQERDLQRWLSDHDIAYPKKADRKELESIVKENWDAKIATPYSTWDANQMQQYLKDRGQEAKHDTKQTKDTLVSQVKNAWYETEDQAQEAYLSVKDWIFDSWNESHLRAFLEKHGIPVPHPPTRANLAAAARNNYDAAAKKAGESASYPGNWLYASWSESDLRAWLQEHGYVAPKNANRETLIAAVRRNSRLAGLKLKGASSSVSSAASSATDTVSDTVFDTWSDSKIKEWADKNGIKVPQGSTRNELLALARKNKAYLTGDDISAKASNAYGAATSKVGDAASQVTDATAKATDSVKQTAEDAFNAAIGTWSDSRLKAFLDARGVPVPQSGKRDELLAAVRLQKHKAATGYSAWTFDTWTVENLKSWLSSQGHKASDKTGATRDELLKQAQDSYASASQSGGSGYASITSALAKATGSVKDTTFDTWTQSDLKAYLDSYGVPVPQGTKTEELKAMARRQSTYFRYGTSSPSGTILAKFRATAQWVLDQLRIGAASGRKQASYQSEKAADYVKEKSTEATHRAEEAAQRAKDRVKEEL